MAPRRAAAVSAANNLAAAAAAQNRTVSSSITTTKQASSASATKKENAMASTSAQSSRPPAPTVPISPIVDRLRKTWKFAAICQFLFTFDEAFGMSGFESEALESDLDGSETRVIPDLMRRLLYTLTLNRSVDEENWESHLRLQYLKREPDEPLLGTTEEPRSWHALPLMEKIGSIHQLCEWQLWDAERFRKLVKNEEDAQIWRIDPIGWDAHDNTYWLFDDNRLWIQHAPPPPPPLAKAPPKKSSKKAKAEARREAQKRKREAAAAEQKASATPSRARRSLPVETPMRSSPRNRKSGDEAPSPYKRQRPARGRATEEWEEIPPELLAETDEQKSADEDSDLSDPPEDQTLIEADESVIKAEDKTSKADVEVVDPMDVDEKPGADDSIDQAEGAEDENGDDADASTVPKEDDPWVEFEALVITQKDWEWMSTRFAKSKHPDERALHQLLKETVLPKVMADLAELEKQRQHELAMANRKRSSRIALKESEKEERERDRIARQRMEDKMTAIREEEEAQVRREREERDAVRIREERLREREERLLAREREAMDRVVREAEDRESREKMRELRKLKREQIIANGGHPPDDDSALDSMDTTPAPAAAADEDSWELDCEVCGAHGINLEETGEIVCCEDCGIWQHIRCWDAFDRRCDRPQRDWEKVDFYCSRCRPPPAGQPRPEAHRVKKAPQPSSEQKTRQGSATHPASPAALVAQAKPVQRSTQQSAGPYALGSATPTVQPFPSANSAMQQSNFSRQSVAELNATQHNGPGYMQPPYLPYHNPALSPASHNQQVQSHQQAYAYPSGSMYPPENMQGMHAVQNFHNPQPTYSHQQWPAQQAMHQQYNFHPRPAPQHHAVQQQGPSLSASQPQTTISHAQPAAAGIADKVPSGTAAVESKPDMPAISHAAQSVSVARPTSSPLAVTPNVSSNLTSSSSSSYKGPSATLQASNSSSQKSTPSLPIVSGQTHSTAPTGPSQINGAMHATQHSPSSVPGVGNGSSPHFQAPMRSPTSSAPHRRPSQPSGSFPMRYATARSPLSGPPQSPISSTGGLPPVSLPPPVRSGSPSPASSKQMVQPIRSTQHGHTLLHGRQTPQTPQAQAVSHGAATPATGPGPIAGSLARADDEKSSSYPHVNGNAGPAVAIARQPSSQSQTTSAIPSAPAASTTPQQDPR